MDWCSVSSRRLIRTPTPFTLALVGIYKRTTSYVFTIESKAQEMVIQVVQLFFIELRRYLKKTCSYGMDTVGDFLTWLVTFPKIDVIRFR